MSIHIIHVVGARPNFMKAAPVINALSKREGVVQTLIHTGQHYDLEMSEIFFNDLQMPKPAINLEVGSGSHAQQTAEVMIRLEPYLCDLKPDLVMVYGDVNSTLAGALVCSKLLIPVAHVEAGLRSFDRTMPEEINRLLTDQLADLLFTHSAEAEENLLREGIPREKIHFVGNVMIDTLKALLLKAEEKWPLQSSRFGCDSKGFALVTLHRPSNVDSQSTLAAIMKTLNEISRKIKIIFPVHPRTRKNLEANGLKPEGANLHLVDPMGYLDFLALQTHAALVITDSGGIQEETSYLGVPCLTLRENTERPITITCGTNVLIGNNIASTLGYINQILSGKWREKKVIPLWDGYAAERIAEIIVSRSLKSWQNL